MHSEFQITNLQVAFEIKRKWCLSFYIIHKALFALRQKQLGKYKGRLCCSEACNF